MDVIQGIFKPIPEVDMGGFAASHEGIDYRCIFCRTVVAAKEIIFLSQSDRPHAVFD